MGNNSTTLVPKAQVIQEASQKTLIDPDDPDNKPITFETLYKDSPGPVIFKFLRRFGCALCKEGALQMCKLKPLIDEKYGKGVVNWVGICFEKVGYEEFKAGKFFDGKIFLDETRELYKTAGFIELGVLGIAAKMVASDIISKTKEAEEKGFTGDLKGDKGQLGGMLVVSPEGEVLYYFKQESFEDEPMKEEILKTIEDYFVSRK